MVEHKNRVEEKFNHLHEIVMEIAAFTGTEFYRSLVSKLAIVLKVRCVVICEVVTPDSESACTLAIWGDGKFHDNFEYTLTGTPWENIAGNESCYCPGNVKNFFPKNGFLSEIDVESCFGVPIFDSLGKLLGILVILPRKELTNPSHIESILEIAAVLAAAEIQRTREEEVLRREKQEAENGRRMKTELLERLSHDLRSPMNVILGYTKLLESDPNEPLSKAQHERIQWICKGADRMMEIITEMSAASRGEESLPILTDRLESEEKTVASENTGTPSNILYIEDNMANLRLMEKLIKRRSDTRLVTTPA